VVRFTRIENRREKRLRNAKRENLPRKKRQGNAFVTKIKGRKGGCAELEKQGEHTQGEGGGDRSKLFLKGIRGEEKGAEGIQEKGGEVQRREKV